MIDSTVAESERTVFQLTLSSTLHNESAMEEFLSSLKRIAPDCLKTGAVTLGYPAAMVAVTLAIGNPLSTDCRGLSAILLIFPLCLMVGGNTAPPSQGIAKLPPGCEQKNKNRFG
jgi:hypothetical protein